MAGSPPVDDGCWLAWGWLLDVVLVGCCWLVLVLVGVDLLPDLSDFSIALSFFMVECMLWVQLIQGNWKLNRTG